jgi:hypothetical protein
MRWAGAAGVLAAIAAIPAWSFASAASKMGSTHPACTKGPTTTSAWRAELAERLGAWALLAHLIGLRSGDAIYALDRDDAVLDHVHDAVGADP